VAEIKIESILESLDYEMKRALEDVASTLQRDAEFDRDGLFREFRRAIGRKCSTWVRVKDQDVKKRCRHCGENT
jgi:hypothetical protein